jgi:glycosyltransferase involved in cell wall biosynthesis
MKILHLIDSGGLYGAEQMLLTLVSEQIKQGLEPTILSCGEINEGTKALEHEAIKRGLPLITWRMKAGLNIKGSWEIAKLAKKEQINVIHSHGYKFNVLFALLPRMLCSIPIVSTVHGYVVAEQFSAMWLYQILDKFCLSRMQAVIFVSQETQKLFNKLKKSYVVQNGITTEPLSIQSDKRFKDKKIKLVAIGRLAKEKGFEYLIKAIQIAKIQDREFELDIMGTGPEEIYLKGLVSKSGLDAQVNFLQFIDNPSRYFDNYDLLVMPSLTEGLPITLLEALREYLPVLATNVGEIPHVIGNCYPLLDKEKDLDNIYSKIIAFEQFYHESGNDKMKQLNDRFKSIYSASKMANKYKTVYQNL